LLDDVLDVAGGQALGVQGQDLLVEAGQAALVLADELGLEGASAVARDVQRDVAHLTLDGLLGVAVAAVLGGAVAGVGRLEGQGRLNGLAGEVGGHLGVEHALQGRLHHAPEKGVEVVDGAGLGGHLAGQSFGLGSQFRVHASISVKGTGWAI